jgi:transcriptional regulator with GAF, ATPase, and Fis domain
MGSWNLIVRTTLALTWVAIALVTVRASTRRDVTVDLLKNETLARREQLRRLATSEILTALLQPARGTPNAYSWTVYIYDNDKNLLRPSFPTAADDEIKTFAPGHGATGLAYQTRELIVVTDDAVSDATYGLSPKQQEHFAGNRTVVAAPIWFESDVLGVLTAISKVNDGYFSTGPGGAVIRQLADVVGVVLTNIQGPDWVN